VLTAEAMVKELDPRFDLRACENRFFGRLMQIEAVESLDPRRVAQRFLDARFRFRRILESVESIRETPRDVLTVTHNVRRRVQIFSVLTIFGWAAVLIAVWTARAGSGLPLFGYPVRLVSLAGAVVSFVLLLSSIFEVRRLPESDPGRLARYPHRLR
jgi:hypothetical protein